MTHVAVGPGADGHCGRCGQRWDAVRLATVATYAVWVSEQMASSTNTQRLPASLNQFPAAVVEPWY
jgi:hypothetical protein